MYTTYVLYSPGFNKIYIGFTSELTNRLMAHNDSRNTGWSSRYQPWELLYSEEYPTKAEALQCEMQLKRQSFGIQFVCRKNKEREKNFTICARITINGLATTVTLSNGVPIETVSKMLGHTSIKTTHIYTKIVDAKISEDIRKNLEKILVRFR